MSERRDRDPDGHHTRVSYILRRHGFERHCGPVSRICLLGSRGARRGSPQAVLTASRDGTLKYWDFPNETHGGASSSSSPAQLRCSLEEHTAWVNDAVVLPPASNTAQGSGHEPRHVVSASNDHVVKVWQTDEEKQGTGVVGSLLSLRYHVDYVTSLAYAPSRRLLASAGLDARAVVSDLEAATQVLQLPTADAGEYPSSGGARGSSAQAGHRGQNAQPRCVVGQFAGNGQYLPFLVNPPSSTSGGREAGAHDHGRGGNEDGGDPRRCGASVWSLAITRSASVMACGTASCTIRGWDPRSGVRLWRLRGHTENVRALVLSDDGTVCVSGSADHTVRVWDIGMRRCIHVFDGHHDSVWSLAVAGHSCGYSAGPSGDGTGAGGALTEVFSGGRDGLLLSHNLRLMQTGLVVREPSPLQALAVPFDGGEIWASAEDSHVRRHPIPSTVSVPFRPTSPLASDAVPPPGATPAPVPALPPAAADDSIAIVGTPRLVDYKVLDSKRQVLVRDACDQLALWDVTNGHCADVKPPAPPPASGAGAGLEKSDDVLKRAFAQLNRPVSVPNWFSCDVSLGSLSVYLDSSQCFRAEPDEADLSPRASGAAARGGPRAQPELQAGGRLLDMGTRTLRALFGGWVRMQTARGGARGERAGERAGGSGGRGGSAGAHRAPRAPYHRFVAPPGLPEELPAEPPRPEEQGGGGGGIWRSGAAGAGAARGASAPREQQPGAPAEPVPPHPPEPGLGGGSSSSSFPPSTAVVLVTRSPHGPRYRGRLYCGYFNGQEAPELLPAWVVDVVYNQRPPPEELCGERALAFTLMRSPSESALPKLPNVYCVARPRTHVRRVMSYLVEVLDFDWNQPPHSNGHRPTSSGSLVSRLGRCCVAPATRGRAASQDSLGSQSDGGEGPRAASQPRRRSGSRDRGAAPHGQQGGGPSGARRSFGLRRGDEEAAGANGEHVVRVRVDSSPARGDGAPAGQAGAGRRPPAAASVAAAPGAPLPDESVVELLCSDLIVEPDLSLATVRDLVWKKPGSEMVLLYRRASRGQAAAPPEQVLMPGAPGTKPGAGAAASSGDARASEDVKSELKLNGVDAGDWATGEGGNGQQQAAPPKER